MAAWPTWTLLSLPMHNSRLLSGFISALFLILEPKPEPRNSDYMGHVCQMSIVQQETETMILKPHMALVKATTWAGSKSMEGGGIGCWCVGGGVSELPNSNKCYNSCPTFTAECSQWHIVDVQVWVFFFFFEEFIKFDNMSFVFPKQSMFSCLSLQYKCSFPSVG